MNAWNGRRDHLYFVDEALVVVHHDRTGHAHRKTSSGKNVRITQPILVVT